MLHAAHREVTKGGLVVDQCDGNAVPVDRIYQEIAVYLGVAREFDVSLAQRAEVVELGLGIAALAVGGVLSRAPRIVDDQTLIGFELEESR